MSKVASIALDKLRLSLALKFFWLFLTLTILSLSVLVIYQLITYTSAIYIDYSYGKRIEGLNQENKILEVNLAKANSLLNIGNYAQNFEKDNQIKYIRILKSTAVAK